MAKKRQQEDPKTVAGVLWCFELNLEKFFSPSLSIYYHCDLKNDDHHDIFLRFNNKKQKD